MEKLSNERGYSAGSAAAPYVTIKNGFGVKLHGDLFTSSCEIMLPFHPQNLFPTDDEYRENMERAQRLVDEHLQKQFNALQGDSNGQ